MNKAKLAISAYLAVVGLVTVSAADAATLLSDVAPEHKIEACVAQIADNADYSDATKVEHIVESSLYLSNKHKLRIETHVFDETGNAVVREYASICIAPNGGRPVTIKTRERS